MQALLGTRVAADITLVAELLMLVALWIGFYFARTKQIAKHRNVQTAVVIANSFFILFVMVTSFYNFVILGGTTGGTVASLMMVHGLLGLIAQLTGVYLVLRMRTELIPPRLRVRNFKLVMRCTIALWTVIVVIGLGIYSQRYLMADKTGAALIVNMHQAGDDLMIHGIELNVATQRSNLQTAKRHAEHLANLIEGKTGEHYGDLDKDGSVEDPGDGTGLLNYLEAVVSASSDPEIQSLARTVRGWVITIRDQTLAVIDATDLPSVDAPVKQVVSLAELANQQGIARLISGAPNTVTVLIDQFEFMPATATVRKGSTVVWINREASKHTVTADGGAFDSGGMELGSAFSFTFNEAGIFPYHCEFHGDRGGVDMAGTIIVQ